MKQKLPAVFNSVGCSKKEQTGECGLLGSSGGDVWRQSNTSGLKIYLRLLKRDVTPFHPAGAPSDPRERERGAELRLVQRETTMPKQLRKQSRNRRGAEF